MPLTDISVKAAKPRDKDYWLSDERGLRLLVNKNGGRYWRLKYRHQGKQKTLALGVYPEVSLKHARNLRDDARSLVREGIDPSVKKQADRRSADGRSENTLEKVAIEWLEIYRATWTEDHAARTWQRLNDNLLVHLGRLPIDDIKPQMIAEAIRSIEKRKAYDTAKRVLQDVNRVYDFAIQMDRISFNPAQSLRGMVKAPKPRHMPSLSRKQLPQFLSDLAAYDSKGRALTKLALNLLVLTFVRPGELRGARWAEFDMEARLWRIPAERMKMKTEHLVPLSDQAIEILTQIYEITGRYDLLFPSERNRFRTMSDNTLRKALFTMGYDGTKEGKPRVVPHGFRSTATSILNEQNFNPDAIERQLSHTERNGVRAAYIHHARFMDERRELMQWWADYLDSCLTKGLSNA